MFRFYKLLIVDRVNLAVGGVSDFEINGIIWSYFVVILDGYVGELRFVLGSRELWR